jgi:Zn finger protein HypA/HybF involved in hydrogenase expression
MGDVIWSCPDCDGDLDDDGDTLWCPACQQSVSAVMAGLHFDLDDDERIV